MRRFALFICVPVLGAGILAASARPHPATTAAAIVIGGPAEQAEDAPLIVHEWGTFTSFSGSDGVQVEFRPLVHNDLPPFVMNSWKQLQQWNLSKSRLWAFQRMETPVTYFYTPVERDVQVRVSFPQGLLTEFFPPVQSMTPSDLRRYSAEATAAALQGREQSLKAAQSSENLTWDSLLSGDQTQPLSLENSSLDWGTVHLIPIDSLSPQVQDANLAKSMGRFLADKIVPEATDPHYAYARDVDAALVNIEYQQDHPWVSKGDYFERFLFYRGLGNFRMPLTLTAHGEGAFQLTNSGEDAVRSLFLVTVRNGAIHFNVYSGIKANAALSLTESTAPTDIDALANSVTAALVREGLYQKEAEAMVNSWRNSWFAEEGTRLLYMVPQRITDELLPLEVSPQPDEVVRVLVGRMEIMSPEDETRIQEIVHRSAAGRAEDGGADGAAPAGSRRLAAFEELVALGRLAEPALVRVKNIAPDPVLRNEAATLIGELRQHYEQDVAVQ